MNMIKCKFVDVCRPVDLINSEVSRLQNEGYVITGQHGGGGYGSCLVLKKGETEEEIKRCEIECMKHALYCEEYWNWHNKMMKGDK